ncbi:hypothetical protein AAG570_011378 [Ranatra chinensis]|uniref:Helicase ATP-binding domain-containing protein n=1 Tax=Ranatra chinensis TaxID=642074 RepID=A0ABD0YKG2_9HEMI
MEENVYEKFELRENRAEDFVPREYQVEILEKALKHNTIVYLPTGSGKTFIAAMLIKYKSQCLLKKYTDGGKRTFFLVNTVALVSQQAESLRRQLPLEIGEYCGYMGVDYWNADIWKQELDKNQVLVMTAQVFLNMLHHGYISLPDVNLLIMDECHHAVNHHAMRQIMQQFEGLSIEQQPHILGLTATLLNSNCKSDKVESEIHSLEVTLQSKIVSAVNEDMVQVCVYISSLL